MSTIQILSISVAFLLIAIFTLLISYIQERRKNKQLTAENNNLKGTQDLFPKPITIKYGHDELYISEEQHSGFIDQNYLRKVK
jgi:hypothetical protein